MDFKNKFSRKTEGERNGSLNNPINNANPFANTFATSNIYQKNKSSNPPPKQSASSLNKFKKTPSKGAAPKGQYKKYLSQGSNVFYEDRPQLKQLEKIKLLKWGLFLLWFVFASTYFIIGRIQPYDGICPQKATCGVFVHCPELFQYDITRNQCKLSSDFLKQFQDVARSKIQKLHQDYAERQCAEKEGKPEFNVNDLLNELQDQEKIHFYKEAANNFFKSKNNQLIFGFKVDNKGTVTPTKKSYTLACSLKLYIKTSVSYFQFGCIILGLVLFGFIVFKILQSRKYSKMYEFLKNKVFDAPDKTLNVTHTLTDLEAEFGQVNESVWTKINDLRASDKKIAYYQDDFLYWKAT